jgi:hypothetical protein
LVRVDLEPQTRGIWQAMDPPLVEHIVYELPKQLQWAEPDHCPIPELKLLRCIFSIRMQVCRYLSHLVSVAIAIVKHFKVFGIQFVAHGGV